MASNKKCSKSGQLIGGVTFLVRLCSSITTLFDFSVCFFFSPTAKETRHWNAGQNALNVETAGYGMMTQLLLHRTGYAGPIVTYLTNQRKGGMGFVSTQVRIQPTAQ